MSVWVFGVDGCWRLKAKLIPLAHFKVIAGAVGCAAVGAAAALRGGLAPLPPPVALETPPAVERAAPPLLPPGFFVAPPGASPYQPVVLFPPGGPVVPIPDFAPPEREVHDVNGPGSLALFPALLVIAALRKRRR